MYYQMLRRLWRFGQKHPVNVSVVISKNEGAVLANIKRKEHDAKQMSEEMVKYMSHELNKTTRQTDDYIATEEMQLPQWI